MAQVDERKTYGIFGKVTVMRKVLIGLLLAGAAATPAIAGPHNNNQQQTKQERQQAHEERVQARQDARSERSASRSDNRPSFAAPQSQPRQQMVDRPQFDRSQRPAPQVNMDAMRAQRAADAAQRNAYAQQQRAERVDQRRDRVEQRQQDVREARESRQVIRDRRNPPVVSNTPRPGTQPPLRGNGNRVSQLRWDRNWQHDGHHDWRRYRDHHRSLFHLGFYIDPFGWNYQPYGIGYRMWPAYYGNQYWLDPAMYNLPFPPPGCAWVRYWNDAVLVDLYTGTIVDQIPGFFW
jgi:Ni/Co efflux regulator RcnB